MRTITPREYHLQVSLLTSVAVAMLLIAGVTAGAPPAGSRLLARDQAARLGLVRAWFAQVQLDSARAHVERSILAGNQLFVLTSDGTLQAFDALTGASMWVVSAGNPDHPSLGPTANEAQVAIVNGSTLHVFNRADGQPSVVRRVGGTTGASPAMSKTYCFVPMLTGRVEGYPVQDLTEPKWFYQSQGRAMTAPRVTDASVVWTTDQGHVYVGNAITPKAIFRVETGSEIVATPAYRVPIIYIATVNGEMIAVHESTGAEQWRFAAEYPILRSPAAIGGRVFVTTLKPEMFAVDAASGATLWAAPRMTQFAAMSRERVYAIDSLNALVVLDGNSGAVLGRMPTDGTLTALVNDQTDWLYLISKDGKVQCLHELGAAQPLYHNPPPTPPVEAAPARPAESAPVAAPPAVAPPGPGENPFGEGPAAPATPAAPRTPTTPPATPADQENPFGGLGGGVPPAGGGGDPFGGR
jgi:outer membrane protein assembly factor BamB